MKADRLTLTLAFLMRVSMISVLLIFLILIGFIFIKGVAHLNLEMFAWEYNSNNISMTPAIINTLNMVLFALALAMPLGIFGAIYLSEYGSKKSKILNAVRIASETLVGIPSIVYGLFGYLAFVLYFGFKTSFVAGGLTLAVMILPLILRSAEEA
ncbi:phosphate ABC transporter permease PstA, partial [Campylobacter upsaliensis]